MDTEPRDRAALLVLTGPPGAGKSSVATLIADRFDRSAVVAGDRFYDFVERGGILPWLPEASAQNVLVTEAAAAAAGRMARGGYAVIFDGVVGPWLLSSFAMAAEPSPLHYAVLMPSEEECMRRVETRTDHLFRDRAVTRQLHGEFAKASVASRHVITVRTGASAAQVADRVLREMLSGTLVFTPEDSLVSDGLGD